MKLEISNGESAGQDRQPGEGGSDRKHSKEYFRRLCLRLKVGLMAAFVAPIVVLSLYFHFQFNFTLKETGKLQLTALAESQRTTIDLFLQERLVNVFSLFHSSGFSLNPSEQEMERHLIVLQQASEAFIDVGLFDPQGVQIGYAGPFGDLRGRDYSNESWYATLVTQDQNYLVSDIYRGLRDKPHFTIAVKQRINGKPCVLRATLDPEKFYVFLSTMSGGKSVDSVLLNKEGRPQILDLTRRNLPPESERLLAVDYMPPRLRGSGAAEVRLNGGRVLAAWSWLKEAPWVLIVKQPLSVAYAEMYRARKIMILGMVFLILLAAAAIWRVTERLLRRTQAIVEAREELHLQLLHASKLASVGELATGVAHEINNPLAIIVAESGVIRDMLDPELGLDSAPETIREELDNIDSAVFRARGIIQKLMNYARKHDPLIAPCNLNQLIDDVVGGLKEREFQVSNIQVVRDYDANLPEIPLDSDQFSQVFLNLINNAGDAIEGAGTITLSTRHEDGCVCATVADTGQGIAPEELGKIFFPFHTTKEVGQGTGLGLSISLSIVEAVGGRIDVQSTPGKGSAFTVVLPTGGA